MSALFTFVVSVLVLIYILLRKHLVYWKKRKVPYLKPLPFFGNYKDHMIFKTYPPLIAQEICKKFPDAPYVGSFYGTAPALLVKDPELIKLILTKDFYYFSTREVGDYTHHEVMTQNLFFTQGDRWKVIRQNLTPLFTSGKMKNMFYLIKQCTVSLEELMENLHKSRSIEATDLMARYTIDCISSCAFGVDSKVMKTKDANTNPFKNISGQILEVSTKRAIKYFARVVWPRIFYGLGFKTFHEHVNKFFHEFLTGVFQSRQYKPTNRNDFVDLILSLKIKDNVITGDSLTNLKTGDSKKVHLELNDDLMVAQCLVLFLGGYETSAFTLSFTLYELAKHEEAQKRAIAEVDEYWKRRGKESLDYDCVTELPYLMACIQEAMRMYPILGIITREVVENYTLPDGLQLDKGLKIHIPVQHLHYDPQYFPEPEKYRPERFLENNNITPFTYLPFGDGQRICIGTRFAKMQMMAALVTILKKYRLELAEGMPRTIKLEPRSLLPHPVGGIHLKFVPRH